MKKTIPRDITSIEEGVFLNEEYEED